MKNNHISPGVYYNEIDIINPNSEVVKKKNNENNISYSTTYHQLNTLYGVKIIPNKEIGRAHV